MRKISNQLKYKYKSLLLVLGVGVAAVTLSCSCFKKPQQDSTVSADSIQKDTVKAAAKSAEPKKDSVVVFAESVDSTARIKVNGVSLFYEVTGKGKPVILLHGNSGSHKDLDVLQKQLTEAGYRVYGIDSRGQGANAKLKEYHYADMAEDVYQFIQKLELGHPAVYGWSDGGNVALQMEVLHPGTCALIITSGSNIFPAGWGGEKAIKQRIASHPNPAPLYKMLLYEPTMKKEDMKKIKCPALICAGERDIILREHTRMIAENIPCGTDTIIKGETHYSYVQHSPKITPIVLGFLQKNNY